MSFEDTTSPDKDYLAAALPMSDSTTFGKPGVVRYRLAPGE